MADEQLFTDIVYGQAGRHLLFLDLYLPAGAAAPPLVVYIHGGGDWRRGDKYLRQPPFLVGTQRYAVASINYRLSLEAPFPAQFEDCMAALRWLRANPDGYAYDQQRLGAWGYGGGALLAGLLATAAPARTIDAGVGVAGLYDLTTLAEWQAAADAPVGRLLGGAVADMTDQARAASPLLHVQAHSAPLLLIHGTHDEEAPFTGATAMQQRLQSAGVPSKLLAVEGAGHSFPAAAPATTQIEQAIQTWFDRFLSASSCND